MLINGCGMCYLLNGCVFVPSLQSNIRELDHPIWDVLYLKRRKYIKEIFEILPLKTGDFAKNREKLKLDL